MVRGDGKSRSILIAGGCGFIGSHLVDRLLKRSDVSRIVVVDNLWTGTVENLRHVKDDRLVHEKVDVEQFNSDLLFDEIYHLASPASPPWYMKEPERTISANLMGAFRLRELLAPEGTFCFTSTSEVYGDPLMSPQPESYRGSVDCTGPRSSYDESKCCTEAFLFESHRLRGIRIKVVRLFNVYGPRTRADDGRAVSNFIMQALRGHPLTIFGSGDQSRSWGNIDDIVEALERFFWRDQIEYDGPVNVGNDREISVIDVGRYICGLVPGTRILHCDPVPQDPTNRCPDLAVARRLLPGWNCGIPYEKGVDFTLRWFSERLAETMQSSNLRPASGANVVGPELTAQ